MTRPTAAPEPFEEERWWRSKPAARALDTLAELEVLVRTSGRTVEIRVTPLTPPPELERDANGKPIVLLPGDVFRLTHRRALVSVAQEALRRSVSPDVHWRACDGAS